MQKYDHTKIEKKWQKKWQEDAVYSVGERDSTKEKEYVLVEMPYPSGNLHIGHWYAFAVPDIYVRFKKMQGAQVMFPMGFDAFGLPAENAAIKHDKNPKEWTEKNIAYMREQLESMGAAFSWDKTASSTDEDYYKWTQWMFTEFFKNDIAYRGTGVVNWCESCHTVIANEQVLADNTCERCGTAIEKKEMPQWMLKITQYADRLVDDLDGLDWPEHIKETQKNWIGRSEGSEIEFKIKDNDQKIKVFTTRADTLFGATYMVLAPEHDLIHALEDSITNIDEVRKYILEASKKAEMDRLDMTKEKTGVQLKGVAAINPANGEEIPVFIADYVLVHYGTGAVMAVPAHDERDFAFARHFDLPIRQVVAPETGTPHKSETRRDGGCAVIFDPDQQKYAVGKRPSGLMGLYAGGREDKESIQEAILREVREESGFHNFAHTETIGTAHAHYYNSLKKKRVSAAATCMLLILEDTNQLPLELEEHEDFELAWATPEEILQNWEHNGHGDGSLDHWRWFLQQSVGKAIDLGFDTSSEKKRFDYKAYTELGVLINSNVFDDLTSEEAKQKITEAVGGEVKKTYKLRDWSVGRQRYWGVPIPIVYDPEGNPHAVPKEHLPWTLPEDVDFRPTGEPPLAKSNELKERTEKIFGKGWVPEVETMDTFLDSSWYFLRYIDNKNGLEASSLERQKEWMPVDTYFGGPEHTTMHLLYSRFWQKALFDLGYVSENEPYTRRINRGLILGPDGNKMSKSKGNVINPDEHVQTVGADTVRMYLAFMGPYGEVANYPWDMGGIAGIRRFLERVCALNNLVSEAEPAEITKLLHKTIEKVSHDIPEFKFNTAISALMIFTNAAEKASLTKESYSTFLQLLAPFAPHLSEELWKNNGNASSIHTEQFPLANSELTQDTESTIVVQINGKKRGSVDLPHDSDETTVIATVRADEKLGLLLTDEPKRTIYVANKLINFVL